MTNKLYDIKKSIKNKYHFFYSGYFSQWYRSNFSIDGIEFNTCEQYMMAEKAKLFGDTERYNMIMESKKPWDQKMHGRLVKGYNDLYWDKHKIEIVTNGNFAKFSQNEDIKQELMKTGDKIIVEASPVDRIWGIGLGMDDPDRYDEKKWKGQNLLGKCLMEVRVKFK